MNIRAFILAFLCCIGLTFAQEEEITYKEYSYSELFEMIEAETDSVFELENAIIKPDLDSDTLFFRDWDDIPVTALNEVGEVETYGCDPTNFTQEVDVALSFNNVHFHRSPQNIGDKRFIGGVMRRIRFTKPIRIVNTKSLSFSKCVFEDTFILSNRELNGFNFRSAGYIDLDRNNFNGRTIVSSYQSEPAPILIDAYFNLFNTGNRHKGEFGITIFGVRIEGLRFYGNRIDGETWLLYHSTSNQEVGFGLNQVMENTYSEIHLRGMEETKYLLFAENNFGNYVNFRIEEIREHFEISWEQFENKLLSFDPEMIDSIYYYDKFRTELDDYANSKRIIDGEIFASEIKTRSMLFRHYRNSLNMPLSNAAYVDLKDLETRRLEYLYTENPNFDTFFTLKTNQFLKLFSDYGTRPAKAIIYSIYVILIFALFYIFFPNSWDTQGRKRLIDRYTFFFKYLRKDAGIHEVYLENKQENLMQYEEFKNLINESGQKVPKFFTATGLPIYKWAVSGTNLSASFLRRFDVIRGRWEDLPKSKRIWKSILITGAFIVAIIYDLFIKALNALMLSVNAFTTLGFGEIPIKGIPRYLAIIQGFIGWFMLTIFSVALISQLLN